MNPKVTFIIPSINRDTLKDSIKSLLCQSNTNWQCIIIYDGVDGDDFDDDRIKTLKIEKTGTLSVTGLHGESGLVRNYGISNCDSEWIAFLDDDDTISENYVKDLFEKYHHYDFVVFRMQYIDGIILPPKGINQLIVNQVGISFCYKNKFEGLLFEDNQQKEDFQFLMKLTELTDNFIITDDVYYKVGHK